MDKHSLTRDRRTFIAAGLATIVAVGAAPALLAEPVSPRAAWDAAMARYRAAEAAHKRYTRDVHDVHPLPLPIEVIEESDRLGDAIDECEDVLIRMPAPDLKALRWKLDRLFGPDDQEDVVPWARHYVAQTTADYRRLLGDV